MRSVLSMAINGTPSNVNKEVKIMTINTEILLQKLYGIYKELTPTGTRADYAEWRQWYLSLLPEDAETTE